MIQQILQGLQQGSFFIYLVLFVILLMVFKYSKNSTTKYNLPPSPPKLPLIGNLHQLAAGSPQHVLTSLSKTYGPIMYLHLGPVPTLVISSADLSRDVFKTYDHAFSDKPELLTMKRLFYGKNIGNSPYGEHWRQVRKLCVIHFLCAKKVESFRFVREEEISLMLDKIGQSTSTVTLTDMFKSLTDDITSRIIFGNKYNDKNFREIIQEFIDLLSVLNIGDLVPSLVWVNSLIGYNQRIEKNFRDVDCFLDEVIGDHIRRPSGEGKERDFVDIMLGIEKDGVICGMPLTRNHSKALILDMYTGGTISTAYTLDWAMSELLKQPEVMREVQEEVRGIAKGKTLLKEDDIENMPILKAVIKETFRLHPPIAVLELRKTLEDVQLQGYDVPAKSTVMINAYAIGRDPKWWEEPERFWPGRFLIGSNASVDFKGQDFQLVPFGAGRRGCPGILFSAAVIEIALANLLNRFDWGLPNGMEGKDLDMEEAPGISVGRKTKLIVTAKPYY